MREAFGTDGRYVNMGASSLYVTPAVRIHRQKKEGQQKEEIGEKVDSVLSADWRLPFEQRLHYTTQLLIVSRKNHWLKKENKNHAKNACQPDILCLLVLPLTIQHFHLGESTTDFLR